MGLSEEKAAFIKAKEAVFHLLKYRIRSEKEIRDKLISKKFDKSIIDKTVSYFKDIDIVDNKQFAKIWLASRLKKPFGFNRIKLELKQKGIDKAIIDEALSNINDDYSENDVAKDLAERRALKYKDIDKSKIKQRVYGYLIRRGFSPTSSYKAIKDL